jgi:hypothetical protein
MHDVFKFLQHENGGSYTVVFTAQVQVQIQRHYLSFSSERNTPCLSVF